MVKLVELSILILYFRRGDVSVMSGLGALVVSPGTLVSVSTVPRPLPVAPVDVTDGVGRVVSMTGTSISSLTSLTTLAPTSASASATTSAAPLILASSSGSCRDFGRLDGCHWCGGGVGCPHVVGAVEDVGVGGGRKVHVRYVVAHYGGQASSPDP